MSLQTIHKDTLEYLTAPGISAPHAFTTRYGGVSTGVLSSLNIAIKEGEDPDNVRENLRRLGAAVGFSPEDLICTRQTHSDIVRVVTRGDHLGCFHRDYPQCDALVTNDPGVALMIYTADCTPLLLHDPVTGAVGAAHAGWRGTASAIGAKTVRAMVENFGCRPENIHAAIGPNIGFCHFETDADVPNAMVASFGIGVEKMLRRRGNKYYVNLKEINALSLRRAGVKHIDISEDCTVCQCSRFWSHRVTQGQRGSQGAVIVCREVQP